MLVTLLGPMVEDLWNDSMTVLWGLLESRGGGCKPTQTDTDKEMLLKHRPKGKQKAEGMVGGRKRVGVVDIIKERFHWYFEIQLTERSKSTEWSKERPQFQTTRIQIGVLFFWNNNGFNNTWVFTAQREIPGKFNKDLYTSDQISRSVVSDSLRPYESGFRKYSLTDSNYVSQGPGWDWNFSLAYFHSL